jgi:hypothetical protein
MTYDYFARAMDYALMDRCKDCGGRLTRDHHEKNLEHMGVHISACEDRRISQDGA